MLNMTTNEVQKERALSIYLLPLGKATRLERGSQSTVLSWIHSVYLTDFHCSDFLVLNLCLDYESVSHGELLTMGENTEISCLW